MCNLSTASSTRSTSLTAIRVQVLLSSRVPTDDPSMVYKGKSPRALLIPDRFQIQVVDLLGIFKQGLLRQTNRLPFVDVASLNEL